MPDTSNLLARAKQYVPADSDVAACWGLVVKAIDVGWLDLDELRELLNQLRGHRDFGVEELLFAHLGERLRVSFLDDQATSSPLALVAALVAVSAADGPDDGG
jgi:hypothetical protein